jgi:NADH pyrophosphatase NudC (nudix superfamily)
MDEFRYCPRCRSELATEVRGGRPRRVCRTADCRFVHWDNPVPVVATIVEREDGIVLVRSRGSPPTWFGLVAGFLEPGERPEDGAAREVEEEIGLRGTAPELVGIDPFELRNQILFTYHMRVPTAEIRLSAEELDACRIVPLAEVVPWNRGTGPALSRWLATRGFHPAAVDFGRHIEA